MFRHTPLLPKGTHGRDIRLEPLLQSPIRPRRQLDDRVQGHLHPRGFFLRYVHVVGVNASQHGLMRHDDDIFAPFQLHDDGFQSDHDIAVGFAASVPVVVLVVVAGSEIFGVLGFDFGVGEAVADPGIEFVEGFPFEFVVALGGVG